MRLTAMIMRPGRFGLCVGLALVGPTVGAWAAAPPPTVVTPERTFDVEAYDVDGAHLLSQLDIERAVYPFLGPGRTREDIDHAREALQKAYADRGFQSVAVELPSQSVNDDIVRLHVVEASVGRLRVTGARYFSPEAIKAQAPAFREGQVPNINEAQKELADLGRLPDRQITPILRAGRAPGTVDVDLKVSDELPLHGSLEVNDDHNQGTPALRVIASGRYDNLWQLGHSLSLTYAVAPQDRAASEVFAGSYLAPIWSTPWSVLAFGYNSNSNVAALGGTDVLGKGYAIGVRGVRQLATRGDISQSFSFGVDYKSFDENINIGDTGTADTVHYAPLTATYNLQRDDVRLSTRASLSVTAGLRGVGSDTAQFQNKRAFADANFAHLNLDLTQTETLWRGIVATERLSGQLSDQPLVSSEQFSAGGLTSVRGYLQSEAVGDDGFSGTLELDSPTLAPRRLSLVDDLRLYAYTDGAVVRVLKPLAEQTNLFSLASVGLGAHFALLRHLKGDVTAAVPLLDGVVSRSGRPRFVFSVKSDY